MSLTTKLKIEDIVKSPNLVDEINKEDIDTISRLVVDEYEIDLQSRAGWEKKTKSSLDLALQVMENKTFPWPGASNVKFPLITIASLQFHARAYPALLPTTDVVKCRVFGEDPTGEKTARAKRVGAHMSYQVLEEDSDW
ncbi:MAG: co-chaperone GroES, partial [Thaumarchaeota archaeon]|nr:co-chaperone GroES [Nitrososphaerota archaeon]